MKLSPLIFSVSLISSCPSLAAEEERFVEFPEPPAKTRTYDLRSVQIIQPGRFSIVSTSVDDPDVMRFELNALNTLRDYCKRPDGNYLAPTDLFTLGPPDLPIKNIEVKSSQSEFAGRIRQSKSAIWHYPYKRLAIEDRGEFSQDEAYFFCKDTFNPKKDEQEYSRQRKSITNGTTEKELFDCKRGLRGLFATFDDEPVDSPNRFWPSDAANVQMFTVTPHSYNDSWYQGICLRVMHEKPYSPD